jgi:Thiamine pyrophosphate enzyme, C-terminal TPP binding domain
MQDFIRPGDVVLADIGTSSAGTAGLRMPNGVTVIGQPLWAAVGYSLPALLGTLLAAPRRRQLLFIGDGAFQMTAQELSTILRRGLKPIIFLVNNNGYTIERLILGPGSSYNDINQWRYAEAASFFDTQGQAIAYRVRTEDELEDALAAASGRETLVLIELVMSRLDAPGALVDFAQRWAEFNFPSSRQFQSDESCDVVATGVKVLLLAVVVSIGTITRGFGGDGQRLTLSAKKSTALEVMEIPPPTSECQRCDGRWLASPKTLLCAASHRAVCPSPPRPPTAVANAPQPLTIGSNAASSRALFPVHTDGIEKRSIWRWTKLAV